ncbi:MAG TPA: hypothetical protein VH482_18760 [Thermomicrobiales bacterium]|jgi:hypothetical protein
MTSRLRTPDRAASLFLLRSLVLVVLIGGLLAACSTNDDESNGATSTPTTTQATQTPTSAAGGQKATPSAAAGSTAVPATLAPGSGQSITDGICQATIPDDWVDNGSGAGTTPSGAKYILFGGLLKTDDEWKQAVQLVKDQAGSQEGAKVSEGDDFVRVDLPDNHGFEYRKRLQDRYCDFSVTSTAAAIPDAERAIWDAIIASLAPAAG